MNEDNKEQRRRLADWTATRVHALRAPVTPAQEGLWFLDRLDSQGGTYNIATAWDLEGDLDVAALEKAFSEVVRRHGALRTRFEFSNESPAQIEMIDVSWRIIHFDLTVLDEGTRWTETARIAAEHANRRFHLEQGLLLRVALVRLADHRHVLILAVHHTVADGWSLGIILRETSSLYSDYRSSRPSHLAPVAMHYSDYAHWQRQYDYGATLYRQIEYWKVRLANVSNALVLPTDRPRSSEPSFGGEVLRFVLSIDLLERLKELAGQRRMTLFTVLMAAFQTLLSRHYNHNDIVVGTPINTRDAADTQDIVGLFVNTLPIRLSFSGNRKFSDILDEAKSAVQGALANADVPFARIVKAIDATPDLSRHPVFQILFAFIPPTEGLSLEGLSVVRLPLDSETSKFDISLFMTENADGLCGSFEFSTGLFDIETIQDLSKHLETVLRCIARNPDVSISDLQVLSDTELNHLLVACNRTERAYPLETAPSIFEKWALVTPGAVALISEEETLTYRELDARANAVAWRLRDVGTVEQDLIAIDVPRSIQQIVAILGVLKAGAIYLPVEQDLPAARRLAVFEKAEIRIVIAHDSKDPVYAMSDVNLHVVDIESLMRLPSVIDGPPPRMTQIDSLAYVMFTSGSTGVPKGVCVPHRGIVRLVIDPSYVTLDSSTVLLHSAPASFDASTFEVWGALLNGGRLVVPSRRVMSHYEMGSIIRNYKVNTLWLTAGLFHRVVDNGLADFVSVRQLLAGGDVLSPKHVRQALERLAGCTIINGYGPTENTTFSCCNPITSPEQLARGEPVPIGKPISNTTAYALNDQLQPVSVGSIGELYLGGAGLATGYLLDDELTKSKFVPSPFVTGERLYRTGDFVRLRRNGQYEFVGRRDGQVKNRGYRVELSDVERVLCEHPKVENAAATLRALGQESSRELVAFVVLRGYANASGSGTVTTHEIRSWMRGRLPHYMVPSRLIFVAELPLSPNGKVDRTALPDVATAMRQEEGSVEIHSPTEEALLSACARVLHLTAEHIRLSDNFFDLGGHSLLAVALETEVRKALLVALPVETIFGSQTLADLAAAIDRLGDADNIDQSQANIDLGIVQAIDQIVPKSSPRIQFGNEMRHVVLTGSTGFVGSFVANELLKSGKTKVTCIVRGESLDHARRRQIAAFEICRLEDRQNDLNLNVLSGDITQPILGLSQEVYGALGRSVDVVIHCAAAVNHLAGHGQLANVNVHGTTELLRFAVHGTRKSFNLVSTLSVFGACGTVGSHVDEGTPVGKMRPNAGGYASSKLVAELCVRRAQERGLRGSIFRLGLVTGDSVHGALGRNQWLYFYLESCLALGCYAEAPLKHFSISPVDVVARAIVEVIRQRDGASTVYHILNDGEPDFARVFELYGSKAASTMERVSMDSWLSRAERYFADTGSHVPFYYYLKGVRSRANSISERADHLVSSRLSAQVLSTLGITWPALNDTIASAYINYVADTAYACRQ